MSNKYYIANDGSIHSSPRTESKSMVNVKEISRKMLNGPGEYSQDKMFSFWIIAFVVSVFVALGINKCLIPMFMNFEDELFIEIAPYVVIIGAIAGSGLYGFFYARKVGYSLWSYCLIPIVALLGILGAVIAIAVIWFVAMICVGILIIGSLVVIFVAMLGGG